MKTKYLLMVLLICTLIIKGQTEDPLQYYQLAVGNYWYYSTPMGGSYWLKVGSDSTDDKGNAYFVLNGSMYYQYHLEKPVYLFENNYRLYKLDAEAGEKWSVLGAVTDTTEGMYGIVRKVENAVFLNKKTKLKTYEFYGRQIRNGKIYDTYRFGVVLAYGIGMIYRDNDANPPYELTGAIINGEIIGAPVGIEENIKSIPNDFVLLQNYPNPFNPTTLIKYRIPSSGNTKLEIYNMLGEKVAEVVNEYQNAGYYSYVLDFAKYNLPSGVYFYSLRAGTFSQTKKLLLMK